MICPSTGRPLRAKITPVTIVDETELRRLGDPACVEALLQWIPVLDASWGPVALREMGDAALAALPAPTLPAGVSLSVQPGPGTTTLRVFTTEQRATRAGVLWIHGGGLIGGAPAQDDVWCASIAANNGVPVVATSYGLAPDRPFPRGLEDCFASLQWLLGSTLGVDRVVVGGASAGGGLALSLALLARDRGIEIGGLFLEYPMLDDRAGRPSMERAQVTRSWNRDLNEMAWDAYLGDLDPVPYLAAPGRAEVDDLRELPPVYLDVGTLDAFFDEDLELARKLALADVPVELVVTPGAFHGSEALAPDAPTSRRILAARRSALTRMFDRVLT